MKLFASDFDGTLYFGENKKDIFKNNIKHIKEFQKENVFAVVTGRNVGSIQTAFKNMNVSPDYIAGFNGGLILDHEKVLYEDKLEIDTERLVSFVKENKALQMTIMGKDQLYHEAFKRSLNNFLFDLFYIRKLNKMKKVKRVSDLDQKNLYMCSILCKEEEDALDLSQKIKELNMLCSVYVNRCCIDVVGPHASKQHAVKIIQQSVQAESVYVIGDSYNDLGMIQEYQGFTLESASEEIKKQATRVVKSVAEALEIINQQK